MPRLPERVIVRVRESESDLATLVDGGPPALTMVTPALAELLQADVPLSIVFGPRNDGSGVRVEHSVLGRPAPGFLSTFDAFVSTQEGIDWTGYNPIFPQPDQRNVALDLDRVIRLIGGRDRWDVPVARDFFPRVGMGSADNLRVLVCDGPSLLAWVGAFRESKFGDIERRTLQRLVPALRRRLLVERLLATGRTTRALLDAALDAIPAAAFITSLQGAPIEANAMARLWLTREGRAGRDILREAIRRRGNASFAVTPVVSPGTPARCMVIARPGAEPSSLARVALASARWSLTARQSEVLQLVVEGLTNRTIAASLRIAERTVEVHLTAMFEKAQVESRGELAAAVWRSDV